MPVLVTGATGLIGRALARRVIEEGGQVRAYVRRDDPELRAAGVHLAIGAMDDVPKLESALTRVHTMVHLAGGWWPERGVSYDDLNRDTAESAVIAARAAEIRRIVFLSLPGADPSSSNELLASKGRAEQHVIAAGIEYAIFRCAPVLEGLATVLGRAARGRGIVVPGSGAQRINPLGLRDVVEAILAADARDAAVHGTWELGGAETMTMREAVARAAPGVRQVRALPFAGAPRALLDLLSHDLLAESEPAAAQFGLR